MVLHDRYTLDRLYLFGVEIETVDRIDKAKLILFNNKYLNITIFFRGIHGIFIMNENIKSFISFI